MSNKAFLVTKNGKEYEYGQGHELPLAQITAELNSLGYEVNSLSLTHRHYTGVVTKEGAQRFIKIATSIGMSVMTEHDARWNTLITNVTKDQKLPFSVPRIVDSGYVLDDYFFMVMPIISGRLLVNYPFNTDLSLFQKHKLKLVDITHAIEELKLPEELVRPEAVTGSYKERVLAKVHRHFNAIPAEIKETYQLERLLTFVEQSLSATTPKTAHGDFTPWHIFVDEQENFTLFDGEHASTQAPQHYDLGYIIQRVYSVLKSPAIATIMLQYATQLGVDYKKLQIILAMRAIGGFLDESLAPEPDYVIHQRFVAEMVKI